MPIISFAEAIRDALHFALKSDPSVIVFGLGVSDPKGVFGTTINLAEEFGSARVFDVPTSENAMTGIAIGAAIYGMRPVLTHQRLDFSLVTLDQLVNNAAKWHFMFGGRRTVPITIRLIVGRGWGQGPTHSQNLQAWFAHTPGLKVVVPTTAADAKGLLISSIFDPNPVIFLEHRWLHKLRGEVPTGDHRVPLGVAKLLRNGTDITVVASSYMTIEALHAVDHLQTQGIACDLIDLRTARPIDWQIIESSVRKTGRLLVLDSGYTTGGIAGEIVAHIAMSCWNELAAPPQRLASPDFPEATSPALTKGYHIRAETIAAEIGRILNATPEVASLEMQRNYPHDVPGDWFFGPF